MKLHVVLLHMLKLFACFFFKFCVQFNWYSMNRFKIRNTHEKKNRNKFQPSFFFEGISFLKLSWNSVDKIQHFYCSVLRKWKKCNCEWQCYNHQTEPTSCKQTNNIPNAASDICIYIYTYFWGVWGTRSRICDANRRHRTKYFN